MNRLTERQTVVLAAIKEHIRIWGWPPTLRELGQAVGINSTNGVTDHLDRLEAKGYIVRAANVSRGIRVVERG